MPFFKNLKTYEKSNNLQKMSQISNVLFKARAKKKRREKLELKELPFNPETCLTDDSLQVQTENTFDRLLHGPIYNKVDLKKTFSKVYTSSDSDFSKSKIIITNSFHSPIKTRKRRQPRKPKISEIVESPIGKSDKSVVEKKTSTDLVVNSLCIEKVRDKPVTFSPLSYIKIPEIRKDPNETSFGPFFSDTFRERQAVHCSTPLKTDQRGKIVADPLSPIVLNSTATPVEGGAENSNGTKRIFFTRRRKPARRDLSKSQERETKEKSNSLEHKEFSIKKSDESEDLFADASYDEKIQKNLENCTEGNERKSLTRRMFHSISELNDNKCINVNKTDNGEDNEININDFSKEQCLNNMSLSLTDENVENKENLGNSKISKITMEIEINNLEEDENKIVTENSMFEGSLENCNISIITANTKTSEFNNLSNDKILCLEVSNEECISTPEYSEISSYSNMIDGNILTRNEPEIISKDDNLKEIDEKVANMSEMIFLNNTEIIEIFDDSLLNKPDSLENNTISKNKKNISNENCLKISNPSFVLRRSLRLQKKNSTGKNDDINSTNRNDCLDSVNWSLNKKTENTIKSVNETENSQLSLSVDESENKINEATFTLPQTMKQKKIVKPGKSYRRSLYITRKSIVPVNQSILGNETVDFTKEKFTPTLDSIISQRESFFNPFLTNSTGYVSGNQENINTTNYNNLEFGIRNITLNNSRQSVQFQQETNFIGVTAKDIVLRRCGQTEIMPFGECYSETILKNCQKIGEGVFGEVFLYRNPKGSTSVMKIIPIEGDQLVNGEKQKKFGEILSEIVIAMELSNLRSSATNQTSCYNEVKQIKCVQGSYPARLLELWDLYEETRGSENDSPQIFDDNQLYIILELANGGKDLEGYMFNNAKQAFSVFKQTALALAVAEEQLKFEHRDLHWGNILITTVGNNKKIKFKLNGTNIEMCSGGVEVSIIDFTLSRIDFGGIVIFNNLTCDDDLFSAEGDYQFEVYRLMQKHNGNEWQHCCPYSNILWLHYLLDKSIYALRYKNVKTKIHKEYIEKLKIIKEEILSFPSVSEFVAYKFV